MFRRDLKLFARCLISSLILLCGSVLVGIGAVRLLAGEGSLYRPVKIAVVDGEDSVASRILIRTIRNLDSFAAVLDAEIMTEEDADRAFREGEAAAVVELPEGFVSDMTGGTAAEGRILLSSALAAQSEIVEAVARFGETLLAAGQYGVFAGEELAAERGVSAAVIDDYLGRVNLSLLNEGLGSSRTYFRPETAETDGMGLGDHYAVCWFAFVVFLGAVSFVPLYRTDASSPLVRRMRSLGTGPATFLRWKLLLPAVLRFLLILGGIAALGTVLPVRGSGPVLWAAALAVYVTAAGACLSLCFGNGAAAVCLASGTGLILCGGIVPRPLLPRWLLTVGDLTPFGAARGLLMPVFSGTGASVTAVLSALVWTCAAVLLLYLRWNALVRGEEGV